MSTENTKPNEDEQAIETPVDQVGEEALEAAENAATEEAQSADVGADADSLEEQLAAAQAEAGEFKDRFLRSEAELDNVRKRAEREIIKARRFAVEKFAGDLLGVLDSLDMGQQAAQQESATIESVREGSELTLKMFIDTLTKHGVEQLDPSGEKFDPAEHEAMVTQPSADVEPNTVLETFQKGYKLNDRVLRPARVVVAKAVD